MNVVISVLVLIVTTVRAGNFCTRTSQCQSGQCCQILSQDLIASKRELVTTLTPILKRAGTCEPYKKEGDECDPIDINYNGFCGCEAGTECKRARIPTTTEPPMTTTFIPTTFPTTEEATTPMETTTIPTTTPMYMTRDTRFILTAPPGYAEEFTCVRKQ